MKAALEEQIDRLTRLMGTDEGFYVLALHSFVEYFLRYKRGYGDELRFPELTWRFREELLERYGDRFIEGLYCLGRLGKQHSYANKVRHAFEQMDVEEANAATHLFLTFCKLAGIDTVPTLGNLQQHLDLWKERSSPLQKSVVIRHMQKELEKLRSENSSLLEQKKRYDELKTQLREMQGKLAAYDERIRETEKVAERRDHKLDSLRSERRGLLEERNELLAQLSRYENLKTYLDYLGRLSIYTRTRMDYEQTISRLTPEQEEAVQAISFKTDFLVRGGAGTGKSLVLIEGLRRAVRQNELEFAEGEQAVLVTFTKTLAKYNRYITEIKGMQIPLRIIDTIDSIFHARLQHILPGLSYDFAFLNTYFDEHSRISFFSSEELASEIEEFIFAFALTRNEYVEGKVSRSGMRKRLSRSRREEVWRAAEEASEEMRRRKIFTKNYSRLVLLEHLQSSGEGEEGHGETGPTGLKTIRYLFLDEVQDLTPVALMALRRITTGPMIMAGDMGQSLYIYYSPFARAGIDLRGSTRILKTNFRNTRQVQQIALEFRRKGGREIDSTATQDIFREGPAPELYSAGTAEELLGKLTDKTRIFIEELQYDPENICILVPRRIEISPVQEALASASIPTEDIRSDEFSFSSRDTVRVSTLHSGKGLEFPVVLLYLPYLHRRRQYSEEETEKLLSNLLFVGITRAMDNLNVFTLESDDPMLRALRGSFFDRENGQRA